ncbi:MAG TPA: hypothetical protein VFH51_14460 [Myxococcota bacterium]|nr:hypothetical protein [Myxococcota bacterium]
MSSPNIRALPPELKLNIVSLCDRASYALTAARVVFGAEVPDVWHQVTQRLMPEVRGLPVGNPFRGVAPATLAAVNAPAVLDRAHAAAQQFAPSSPLVADLHQAAELRWVARLAAYVATAPQPARAGYATAVERVRAVHDNPAETTLDLRNLGLASLPPGMGRLTELQALYLSDNPFPELPAELAALQALVDLEIRNTGVTSAPFELNRRTFPHLTHVGTAGTPLPPFYFSTWAPSGGNHGWLS